MTGDVVLDVRGLRTRFGPEQGGAVAVDGVSLRPAPRAHDRRWSASRAPASR